MMTNRVIGSFLFVAAVVPPAFAGDSGRHESASAQDRGPYYSQSIAVSTPNQSIAGKTSGRGPAELADQQLLNKVLNALVAEKRLEGSQIEVLVENGRVTLEGTARDRAQADAALDMARDAAGGAQVSGELKVKG